MKKIAFLTSKYSAFIEATCWYLKDTEIVCILLADNIDFEAHLKEIGINFIKLNYNEINEYFKKQFYDFVITDERIADIELDNLIIVHPSLLPAFNVENPIEEAILCGAKITGITMYYPRNNKIITQYPLFINSDMHLDDIKKYLEQIKQIMIPLVIEKLLNNETFEIQHLMHTSSCTGNCSSCNSCKDKGNKII